jgi:hypothetical protein
VRTPRRTWAGHIEGLERLRTKPEAKRVLARWGWVGEIGGFFNTVFSREAMPCVARPVHGDAGETRSDHHPHRY